MNRTLRGAVGIAAGVLALTVPLTSAANAESQTHEDPRGDVVTKVSDRQAPERGIDITKISNSYEGDTLRLMVKVSDLAVRRYSVSWTIKSGPHSFWLVDATRFRNLDSLSFYDLAGKSGPPDLDQPARHRDSRKNCGSLSMDRQSDKVIVSLGRSCIDDAKGVRISTITTRSSRSRFQLDDARRNGFDLRRDSQRFGPRLTLD